MSKVDCKYRMIVKKSVHMENYWRRKEEKVIFWWSTY